MKNFFGPFNDLPQGIYRLLIVFSILIPLIISTIMYQKAPSHSDDEIFFGSLFFCFISYWIIVRVGMWVFEGFKNDRHKDKSQNK